MLHRLLSASLIVIFLVGCASQRDTPVDPAKANEVTFAAMQQVGKPYRYGGNSPQTGFDCSGLVGYVYRQSVGIHLPRTTKEMEKIDAPTIAKSNLQTGDLLIFATGWSKKPDHAGIYVGQGRFVHAPSSGGKVRLDKLGDDYWQRSFLNGKRPLANL